MVNPLETSKPFIDGRGRFFCRGCLGNDLFSALDLGELPIANELLLSQESKIDKFPLHLRVCVNCGLGQVADVVTPERIFRDYRYESSTSATFLQHAANFVRERVQEGTVSPGDWVLEIASNDGYLLKNFLPHGIRVIGVEPAKNIAEVSRGLGIETISEFFSSELATNLLSRHGYPKLIIANNVMAHVPDLVDFLKGLAILTGQETQITIENPSLANILMGMQFDTIYHEHYSYLSASAVSRLSKVYGLQLFKVEELPTHGGSNRYWLRKFVAGSYIDESVSRIIEFELDLKLFDPIAWQNYSSRVSVVVSEFLELLQSAKNEGRRIFGYGAAAKASTLLNMLGVEEVFIQAIGDASQEKQGRFMPPCGIRIISPQELLLEDPTDIVIFPWNIKSEIADFLRSNLGDQVRLWCAIPEMHQIEEK